MSLRKLCRTCLSSGELMFPLFDENVKLMESGFRPAVEILEFLTSGPISNEDDLPDHICIACLNEIQQTYSFKLKCENSEKILHRLKKVKIASKKQKDLSNQNVIVSESISEIQGAVKDKSEIVFDYDDLIAKENESRSELKFNPKSAKNTEFVKEYLPTEVQVSFKNEPELNIDDINCSNNDCTADSQLKCPSCGEESQSLNIYLSHILTDHTDQTFCKICNEEFDCSQFEHSVQHLPFDFFTEFTHKESTKMDENSIKRSEIVQSMAKQCHHCSKLYTGMHACSTISLEHNENIKIEDTKNIIDVKLKSNQCHVCLKICGQKSSLVNHMRAHSIEAPFQCKFCFQKFRYFNFLRKHMKTEHVYEFPKTKRNYHCTVCSKIVGCKSDLDNHMFTHIGENPFQCNICAEQFHSAQELVCHIKSIHSEELNGNRRNYKCSVCSTTYKYSVSINSHMKTKHGMDLYK